MFMRFAHLRRVLIALPLLVAPAILQSQAEIAPSQSTSFKREVLLARTKELALSHKPWIMLEAELSQRFFRPSEDQDSTWGSKLVVEAPEKGTWRAEIFLKLYKKPQSKDTATLGHIVATNQDGERRTYDFYYVDADGDFMKESPRAIERYVDSSRGKHKVLLAHSWKSCMKKKIKQSVAHCGPTCVSAAVACTGSVWAYAGCVAAACGTCFAIDLGWASISCTSWW